MEDKSLIVILVTLTAYNPIISLILLTIARIKYPHNKFSNTVLIIMVIGIVLFLIYLMEAINSCFSNCEYSVSKLGCFFAGCCHGIKYDGIFSVTYPHLYNYSVFPIQLLESIVFFFIFLMFHILYKKYNSKNIIEYVCIVSAIAKFLLDYLRYSHLNQILSLNQIISLVLIIGILIIFIMKKVGKVSD